MADTLDPLFDHTHVFERVRNARRPVDQTDPIHGLTFRRRQELNTPIFSRMPNFVLPVPTSPGGSGSGVVGDLNPAQGIIVVFDATFTADSDISNWGGPILDLGVLGANLRVAVVGTSLVMASLANSYFMSLELAPWLGKNARYALGIRQNSPNPYMVAWVNGSLVAQINAAHPVPAWAVGQDWFLQQSPDADLYGWIHEPSIGLHYRDPGAYSSRNPVV